MRPIRYAFVPRKLFSLRCLPRRTFSRGIADLSFKKETPGITYTLGLVALGLLSYRMHRMHGALVSYFTGIGIR